MRSRPVLSINSFMFSAKMICDFLLLFSQSEYLVVTDVQESGVRIYSCHPSQCSDSPERSKLPGRRLFGLSRHQLGANIGPGQFILGFGQFEFHLTHSGSPGGVSPPPDKNLLSQSMSTSSKVHHLHFKNEALQFLEVVL